MTYPTKEYTFTNDNGDVVSSVQVYEVTEEHDGENVTTTGGVVQVHTGDVLVQAPNPNFWDRLDAKVWADLGYKDASESGNAGPVATADAPTAEAAAVPQQETTGPDTAGPEAVPAGE